MSSKDQKAELNEKQTLGQSKQSSNRITLYWVDKFNDICKEEIVPVRIIKAFKEFCEEQEDKINIEWRRQKEDGI